MAAFDLEKAVTTWRAFQARRQVYLPEDLDELESHLREHTNHLVQQGVAAEVAFEQALESLGDPEDGGREYAKVYWRKLRHHKRLQAEVSWRISMLKNYAKGALRTMKKQKGYMVCNVLGLAAGLAVCFVITLFVYHELGYDRFHQNAKDLYRIVAFDYATLSTPAPMAAALEKDFPQVERTLRIRPRFGEVLI